MPGAEAGNRNLSAGAGLVLVVSYTSAERERS